MAFTEDGQEYYRGKLALEQAYAAGHKDVKYSEVMIDGKYQIVVVPMGAGWTEATTPPDWYTEKEIKEELQKEKDFTTAQNEVRSDSTSGETQQKELQKEKDFTEHNAQQSDIDYFGDMNAAEASHRNNLTNMAPLGVIKNKLDEEKNTKDVGLEGYVNNGRVSKADQDIFDKAKAQREKERERAERQFGDGLDIEGYELSYSKRQKSNGNIQNFIASMNKSGGYARTARYAVVITPPGNLEGNFQSLGNQVGQQVNLHCSSVQMPGHDLQAQDVQHGSAPGRQMVRSHDYEGTIAATFYLDSHLRERHFFEMWQKMAVSKTTHKANYYDDYIGTMEIFQLDGNNDITYGIKATEVYPATIGGIEYSYANANAIATQSVQFQFRQWFNLTDKSIAGYRNSDEYNRILKYYGPEENR